ncbi:hypothetical protein PoB_004385100 [Plakobranchus ocellatus]|uniref:Uncharacterized protein n=1 Tax=Plakobranchus ocellatus TaxID=259542 RepID=A0AAV4BAA8_9GAST|nr:hypothetical protein PoB_004385100 [Plakobranchus ocellatus]
MSKHGRVSKMLYQPRIWQLQQQQQVRQYHYVGVYDRSYNTTSESVFKSVVISSSKNRHSGYVFTTSNNRKDPGTITKLEANIIRGYCRRVRTAMVPSASGYH